MPLVDAFGEVTPGNTLYYRCFRKENSGVFLLIFLKILKHRVTRWVNR